MKKEVLLIGICNVLRLMNEPINTPLPSPIIIATPIIKRESHLLFIEQLLCTRCSAISFTNIANTQSRNNISLLQKEKN